MADKRNPAYDPMYTGGVQDNVPELPKNFSHLGASARQSRDAIDAQIYDRKKQRAIDEENKSFREKKDWWGRHGYAKGGVVKHGSPTHVTCAGSKVVGRG